MADYQTFKSRQTEPYTQTMEVDWKDKSNETFPSQWEEELICPIYKEIKLCAKTTVVFQC